MNGYDVSFVNDAARTASATTWGEPGIAVAATTQTRSPVASASPAVVLPYTISGPLRTTKRKPQNHAGSPVRSRVTRATATAPTIPAMLRKTKTSSREWCAVAPRPTASRSGMCWSRGQSPIGLVRPQ